MNCAKNKVIVLVLTIFAGFASAEFEEAIRELCRLQIGNFPHPNPSFCGLYVQCQVNFFFQLKNKY